MKKVINILFVLFFCMAISLVQTINVNAQTYEEIATDEEGDNLFASEEDGKALSYYYDLAEDMLYFKVQYYNNVYDEKFGVSLAFDVPGYSGPKNSFWCQNYEYKYNKFAIAWMEELEMGVTGVGDYEGLLKYGTTFEPEDMANLELNNVKISILDNKTYLLEVPRMSIYDGSDNVEIPVVASVGDNVNCTDDIPTSGNGIIKLDLNPEAGSGTLISAFKADKTVVNGDVPVHFTNHSIADPDDPIIGYYWDFDNDGSSDSQEENPTYTYPEDGVYSVKLSIFSNTNAVETIRTDYITVTGATGVGILDKKENVQVNLVNLNINPSEKLMTVFRNVQSNHISLYFDLYNIEGKKVFHQLLPAKENTVSLQQLSKGMYFVKVTGDNTGAVQVEKIMVR